MEGVNPMRFEGAQHSHTSPFFCHRGFLPFALAKVMIRALRQRDSESVNTFVIAQETTCRNLSGTN
jgi:hypothetical protein